jgi:uncharacterized protein (DUF58 family)
VNDTAHFATAEFHYTVRWRAPGAHPGGHPSGQWGGGWEFAGHAPFVHSPDPRHIDIRASFHDPFEQIVVRRFRQRSAIPVFVLADLSASMGFRGAFGKIETLARFTASAAYSAYRSGDPFGFVGCDEAVRLDLLLPLRLHKGAAPGLYERLRQLEPSGRSAEGLHQAASHLGRQRALVFLVSDFHHPLDRIDGLLGSLARHDVVPVVLWDPAEYERLPAYGLAHLEDPETGERRRLFLRPALRERFRQAFAARRADLVHLCTQRGREPFFMEAGFDADALSRYFFASA